VLETSGATSENLKVVSVAGCLGYDVLDEQPATETQLPCGYTNTNIQHIIT
jgi:hypothetical protein